MVMVNPPGGRDVHAPLSPVPWGWHRLTPALPAAARLVEEEEDALGGI